MSLPLERYKNISGVKKNQGGAENNETGLFSVKHKARKILSGSPAGMQPLSNSLQLLHVATFKTRTSMSSCWASNCYSQTGKPWTPEIFLECHCVARKKPIRCEKRKPQARMLISLWFCGLLACPDLCCDWSSYNKHSWNISSAHGFHGRTVKLTCPMGDPFTKINH